LAIVGEERRRVIIIINKKVTFREGVVHATPPSPWCNIITTFR
jgi:hypothetical protein